MTEQQDTPTHCFMCGHPVNSHDPNPDGTRPCRSPRRAAFGRGYEKGRERQKARTAADMRRLEAEVVELRTDRDPDGLRARIRDLEYALDGWDRFVTGRVRAGAAPDWQQQAAEYLAKLTATQRELAVLKGVQPSNATGREPA